MVCKTTAIAVFVAISIVLVIWVWRVLKWVWLKPKKLEKQLRKQGFHGNSYRLLSGDIKENAAMLSQARSKPIAVSNDIVPRVSPFLAKLVRNYGKKVFMWLGPTPRVQIMDPELIKDVLNKNLIFQKPPVYPFFKLLGYGLPSIEGEKWTKHRKLLNPAFHNEKLKFMIPAFYLSCSEMINEWQDMMSEGKDSCEVDVWTSLQTLTRDVISRTAFGSSYEEGRRVFELQTEQIELVMKSSQSAYIPGWSWFLPTKRNLRMKEIDREVRFLLRGIIDKKTKAMKNGDGSTDDLLGLLLESNLKGVQHGKGSFRMSLQDVMEECKIFYVAGQETTSVLLVWTMILLSIHPDWQDRARQEVLQVIGNNKPDVDHLSHLKIVTMVLNEVLRLYPPVLAIFRAVNEKTTLGDITLQPGMQVSLPIILIHRDQDIWGTDANEFNPERFFEGVSKATKNQAVFFPFGGGPRICIGQNFAMLEAKLAMAMILKQFSFELSPSYTHAPASMITLYPQYGASLILHKL